MIAPKTTDRRRRGSVLLVVLGVLAVMMIIAFAFMSRMEMGQMGALNTSDRMLAQSTAEGVTASMLAQLEAQADGQHTYLSQVMAAQNSLYHNGTTGFPTADVTLQNLFYGPAGTYEGVAVSIDDMGTGTGTNAPQAVVTLWVMPHDGLSINHHGNNFGGSGVHSVIQGTDMREVDLARGWRQLMGLASTETVPDNVVTNIVTNHRTPLMSGQTGLFAQSLTDTAPADGLLDAVSGSADLRWTPLRASAASTRFGIESELVLQHRRSQAYATDSSDPIVTHVLKPFSDSGLLTGADLAATKLNWRKFTNHLSTLSRSRSKGVWVAADGTRSMQDRANINDLGTGSNTANLKAACQALDSGSWRTVMGNIYAYTADHTAGVGYACPIDITSSDTDLDGNISPPHRLPVVAGFHWRFADVDPGAAKTMQYGIAVMLVNPFDRPLDLSNMELVLGTAPNRITASLSTAISANSATSGTKVLVFMPDNSADPALEPLFDVTDGGAGDFARGEAGAATDGVDVMTLNVAEQATLRTMLEGTASPRTVPAIELRYKAGMAGGKAGFNNRLIDFKGGNQTVDNSLGSDTDAVYRRSYPFDSTTLAQAPVGIGFQIDAATLNGWASNTAYPRLYLGGTGELFHSVAEVGLLLKGQLAGGSDTWRWFDPDGDGKLDEGDKISLNDMVLDSGGKYVDLFDLLKVAEDPEVAGLETGQVNINTQPVGVLAAIPYFDRDVTVGGTTKSVAQWVVDERTSNGPYRTRGELIARLASIFGDQYSGGAWVRTTDASRFSAYSDGNDIHAKQFPFSVAVGNITTRTDMFTVRVQVVVTIGSGTDKRELSSAVLTSIVDRSTGSLRILNQYWGVPVQQ